MKTYYANPNYAQAANSDNWVVVGAQSSDVAVNDLTQLSVGNISAPTSASSTTSGYYFAHIEDLSRLMKGWSYLAKPNIGPRNDANYTITYSYPTFPVSEPYVYVAEINGFANGDTLAVLEGQQENQTPFSSAALSSDYGFSQWSYVRNAGLIPTVSMAPAYIDTAFLQPENSNSIASRLLAFTSLDYGDTNYGRLDGNSNVVSATKNYRSVFTPTPDNLGNGTIQNWYLTASGDDTAQTNIVSLLPDFTADGENVASVTVGQTATAITLSATNSAFKVGQTVTIVTNGTTTDGSLPYLAEVTSMGWLGGKITSISGATLYTDLNDTTANSGTLDPLVGSVNSNIGFTGTVSTTTTITVGAYSATSNYGLAAGQTITGGTYISAGTTITSIAGNGAGAVLTLSQAVAGGVGTTNVSFTGNYTDYNCRAYAATITDQQLQVNINENQLNCRYATAPYYAQMSTISLGATLSTTGATTRVVLRNNSPTSATIYGATNGPLVWALTEGDYYQEISITSDTTIAAGATATATVTSFTPSYAFPARITSVYDWSATREVGGFGDRYGKILVFPVVPSVYRNGPVARFKGMTALSGGITETISGATYYYGTIGSTYYSDSPYTVSVDDVSNIKAGDTLTFRNDYNPWFSNYPTGQPVTASTWGGSDTDNPVPWSWSLTDFGSGFTCTSGATFVILPDANGYALPLVKGQVFSGANTQVTNGTKITGWTDTQIFIDGTTNAAQASATNATFYPGSSGYNYWKVYSVNTVDNTFVIYGGTAQEPVATTYSTNGDGQNSIFAYDNHFYAGNTIDIYNANGKGGGVVGLLRYDSNGADIGPEKSLGWHTTNTVIGSYVAGGRYIGSRSVGDQEQVTPYRIGSFIGSTLALDVIAQSSSAIAVNALPNTAFYGTYDPNFLLGDYTQYKTSVLQVGQNGGFAYLGSTAPYSPNYNTNKTFPLVVGVGATQEVVLISVSPTATNRLQPITVDGSSSLNAPVLWNLAAGQSFQYDHEAGEPVCLPNFIYTNASTISHAAGAPVIGLPNTGTVYG